MKKILQSVTLMKYLLHFFVEFTSEFCYIPLSLSMETVFRKARDFNGEIYGDRELRPVRAGTHSTPSRVYLE